MINTLNFNPKPSTIMHIDLNSCFATIEQQANPHLRGKPVAVAAYTTPSGCILAPSVEAKRYGIQTGMRVKDGKALCPNLIVMLADPWKYRNVHLAIRHIMADYTADFNPKSIDEFVLNLADYPAFNKGMHEVGKEIKQRIKAEVGDWLTVSVGIAPNRFLAKVASSLKKPDGLDEINKDNFLNCYRRLKLTDLPYIKARNAARLNGIGIYTVIDFYNAPIWKLKATFESILGYYWYLRLHGYEIDNVEFGRRSYGNSYALPPHQNPLVVGVYHPHQKTWCGGVPKPFVDPVQLAPILSKLVTKMGARLRRAGYKASGIHLAISYRDGSFWHKGVTFPKIFFDSRDIYRQAYKIMCKSPYKKPVRDLAVSAFNLLKRTSTQLDFFEDIERKERLVWAVDEVNDRWGDFVITPARMLTASDAVPDRIAFGGIKELEEFTIF